MLSIETLVQNSKGVFNLNRLRLGQDYLLLLDRSTGKPKHLVFEPNVFEYVVFNLAGFLSTET